jgi:hypothetical protein
MGQSINRSLEPGVELGGAGCGRSSAQWHGSFHDFEITTWTREGHRWPAQLSSPPTASIANMSGSDVAWCRQWIQGIGGGGFLVGRHGCRPVRWRMAESGQ